MKSWTEFKETVAEAYHQSSKSMLARLTFFVIMTIVIVIMVCVIGAIAILGNIPGAATFWIIWNWAAPTWIGTIPIPFVPVLILMIISNVVQYIVLKAVNVF